MKKLSIIALLLCASAVAVKPKQPQYVRPHFTTDGTYVGGYYRTPRDNTPDDNYSYRGNYNPYTGATGTGHVQYQEGQTATYQGRQVIYQNGQWYYTR